MSEIEDIDLLDMLNDDDRVETQKAIENSPKVDTEKKVPEDYSSILDILGNSGNPGTGDVSEDLMNWLNAMDKLPSDPLATFLNNAVLKAEFGMFFNLIKNFSRLKKLQDFVDRAEDIYFNTDDIITLSPDEIKERMESASDIMKNLYEMNRRTIQSAKTKGKEEEMDKLKMLLSAIPNNKLKDILTSLNN